MSADGLAMPPDLDYVVRDVLLLSPQSVEPVATQSGLRVHRVATGDQVVFVKHGRAAESGGKFRLEAWAQQLCRANGVLVPDVIAVSEFGDELDYMVTLPLAGRALEQLATGGPPTVTGEALKPILRDAGEQLRRMHEIDVDGFGPIVGAAPRGAYERWSAFLELARTALPSLAQQDVLTTDEVASTDAKLAEALATLSPAIRGRLLHGDLEGDHIFSDQGRFTGLLDFEKLQAGDPVWDLARLAWWDPHMLPDLVEGYGRDALSTEDVHVLMPAYLAANAIVGGEWLAGPPATIPGPASQWAGWFIREALARDFVGMLGA